MNEFNNKQSDCDLPRLECTACHQTKNTTTIKHHNQELLLCNDCVDKKTDFTNDEETET